MLTVPPPASPLSILPTALSGRLPEHLHVGPAGVGAAGRRSGNEPQRPLALWRPPRRHPRLPLQARGAAQQEPPSPLPPPLPTSLLWSQYPARTELLKPPTEEGNGRGATSGNANAVTEGREAACVMGVQSTSGLLCLVQMPSICQDQKEPERLVSRALWGCNFDGSCSPGGGGGGGGSHTALTSSGIIISA